MVRSVSKRDVMARPSTALSTDTERSTASHSDDQAALKLAARKQASSVANSCFEAEENEGLANEHEPWMERFKSEDECGFLLPPRPAQPLSPPWPSPFHSRGLLHAV